MGSYPECDKFECEECPRGFDCIDKDIAELTDEYAGGMHFETPAVSELSDIIEYVDCRFSDIERRLFTLEQFMGRVEDMLAKAVKTYENPEER